MRQSLKNAEEELARHTAVIDQRKAWDRQMIEGVRSGRYQVESGDGRTVGLGRNSDHSRDHVPQWLSRQRDEGLRTVDRYTRSDHLNAPAADRLDALVRASGTKIDPAGIGARYLAAVGLPAYNSAFGKILADPIHGHLRLSPEEVDAVRVVSQVQQERALNEGTAPLASSRFRSRSIRAS